MNIPTCVLTPFPVFPLGNVIDAVNSSSMKGLPEPSDFGEVLVDHTEAPVRHWFLVLRVTDKLMPPIVGIGDIAFICSAEDTNRRACRIRILKQRVHLQSLMVRNSVVR